MNVLERFVGLFLQNLPYFNKNLLEFATFK